MLFRSQGDPALVLAHDRFLCDHASRWLVREVHLFRTRVMKRVDLTSRSLLVLNDSGSAPPNAAAAVAQCTVLDRLRAGQMFPGLGLASFVLRPHTAL